MIYLTSIITALVSIFVCCLSWYLVRVNQNTDLKRQENRKLNRLIFNLLELKFWIDKEVDIDQQLGRLLDAYEHEIIQRDIDITPEGFKEIRVAITEILKQQILTHSEIPALEDNIEVIIRDLAEVDPVFAFELTGKYRITVHMARIQEILDAAGPPPENSTIPQIMVNDILRPKILKDLQKELHIHIPLIAKKTDKKTYNDLRLLPESTTTEIDIVEVSRFLKDLVPKLLEANRLENESEETNALQEWKDISVPV